MMNTNPQTNFPKREAARARMEANAPKYRLDIWDATEKRITISKAFLTASDRNTYLHTNCIERNAKHYHKDTKGRLDMSLEYIVKQS